MILNVLVILSFLAAAFFPLYMLIRTDWNGRKRGESNPAGKSLMAFSAVVAVVLGLAVFRRNGFLPPPWVGITAYVGIVTTLVVQDITLVRVSRRQRRRIERENRERETTP